MEQPRRRERRRLSLPSLGRAKGRRPVSTRDPVTGLMNVSAFTAVAGHVLSRCTRAGEPCGLVRLSLEEVTGEGEAGRARRLRNAARALVSATRGEDVLGRTAVLELCALLPGIEESGVELVAARIDLPGADLRVLHERCESQTEVATLLAAARQL